MTRGLPPDWADQFVRDRYLLAPSFLSRDEVFALAQDAQDLKMRGLFRPARIGRSSEASLQTDIRGDEIHWFQENEQSRAQESLSRRLEELRVDFTRELFLGLDSVEKHYAIYPPGGFYKRHVDRFRDDDARTVSAVLYLNEAWEKSHGGELLLETPSGEKLVEPRGGTLVLFLSAEIPHEVQPSTRERKSIAAWFKRRVVNPHSN